MLFYLLVFVTLLILGGSMWYAYDKTRDPLHPLIYLAPLCVYSYVFKPLLLEYMGALEACLEPNQILFVQVINTVGAAGFCLGALHYSGHVTRMRVPVHLMRADLERILTPAVRQRVMEVAWVLGGMAVGAYWIMVTYAGGLDVVYGQAKGGVRTSSGYLGETPLWCLAAIGLLYLSWAGQPFTIARIITLLVVASPLLVHGLLGARRGPTFMVVAALLAGAYLVSPRRPRLITVFTAVFLLGMLILFLVNNRHRIYLGEGAIAEWRENSREPSSERVSVGDDWIHSGGTILTSRDSDTHFWGTRLLVVLFVRPIPKQIWEDKYIDTGFGWMDGQEDMNGMSDNEWVTSVGWIPQRGAAAGFIADLFLEFSYLSIMACYGFGWLYSYLWKKSVLERGSWLILYLFAAALSVYVSTQSVSAWLHRFTFLAVPMMILWQLVVQPVLRSNSTGPLRSPVLPARRRYRFARPNPPLAGRTPTP